MATIKELTLAGPTPVNDFNLSLVPESDAAKILVIQNNVLRYATSAWFPRPYLNFTWARIDALYGTNQKIAFKVTEIFNTSRVRFSAIKLPSAIEASIRANTSDDGTYYFIWDKAIYDIFNSYHNRTTLGISVYLGVDTSGSYELYIIRKDLTFSGDAGGPPYAGAKIPNT